MPKRRPSPARLLLALLLACVAPLTVVMATGLAGGPVDDQVETADGGRSGAHDGAGGAGPAGAADRTATSLRPPTTAAPTTASPATTATTAPPSTVAPTLPPTTAPPTTTPPTTAAPPPAPPPGDQVVALVNAARADAGCGALRTDDRLTMAAQAHSDDMAANDYFSHDSLDGRTFADRILAAGYPSPGGENIAQGQRSAQDVYDAWMGSEGHRANILNCSFAAIGMGLNAATWTWTQDFGY